jgi:hypothetical protein
MPKPTRDYALMLRNEIQKLDLKIAKLQADRTKLVTAYAHIAGDSVELSEAAAAAKEGDFREVD